MTGRGILILVFSFMVAFSIYQLRLSKAVVSASETFYYSYTKTLVHESALSAMNIGINKVWFSNVTSDNSNVIINGCTTNVAIYPVGTDTVVVKVNAWKHVYRTEAGKLTKLQDSVIAYFSYSVPASRYFWFTNQEGYVYWITGDTVWGPIHTNSIIRTSGSPVFYGKVTAYLGIAPPPTSRGSRAKFYGGWEVGVKVNIPTDMSHLIAAAQAGNGSAPYNTKSIYNKTVYFEFLPDGKVIRTVGGSTDTVKLTDIAPTGVIYATQDVHVKGTLNGKLTIYTEKNIWIDDDIVYADDPLKNPNSDDLLGLVAKNYVIVTDNPQNNHNCTIYAAIMAVNGSFTAQNYWSRPVAGVLRIVGSIIQNRRGAIGMFSWWTNSIVHGYSKRYRFDPRYKFTSPPHYPYVRKLRLVSWWE